MSLASADWLGSFVPLGVTRDGRAWSPVGAGVLLIDAPILWLVTAQAVLQRTREAQLALSAFVSEAEGGTVLDLTSGRLGSPLDWLVDEASGLAVCLFPVDPRWPLKAFPAERCAPFEPLTPGVPVLTVGCAYGQPLLGERPLPLVLQGAVAQRDERRLICTAPLPPQNLGAPLLVPLSAESGGGVALAGVVTAALSVPAEPGVPAAALRLAVATPIDAALQLVRSDAGDAQRRFAIERSRSSPSPEGDACSS